MYLLRRVEVWARNRLKRVVKTPKLQFIDAGLLATLLDLGSAEVQQDRSRFGNVLETFAYSELLKHITTAADDYRVLYCILAKVTDMSFRPKGEILFNDYKDFSVTSFLRNDTVNIEIKHYYRDVDLFEVDVVIENAAGQLIGVEIKASATVKAGDLHGLKKLASVAGGQFKMGVLLYDGTETLPLGDHLWAAPLSTLWGQ
jgi:hypothetical protein